jgi:magnesium-transporting ATPase (P-type)
VLAAGMYGMPVPFTPLQILWLNMVTDTFPALALALEPADASVMRRPPRDPDAGISPRGRPCTCDDDRIHDARPGSDVSPRQCA